ncbi:hypothetical protein AB0K16_31360 [Nonomuraea jabiensis]|uniref:hypothetical protein n=1 Tax=Nonomuraea jabiensis TaxID=882448 RepID=UPI0034397B2C
MKPPVYVAAFAPDEGESPLDLAGRFPGGKLEDALVIRPFPGGGQDGYLDPANCHNAEHEDTGMMGGLETI